MRASFLIIVFSVWGSWGHINWTHVRRRMDTLGGGCSDSCHGVKGPSPSQISDEQFLTSSCFCDDQCATYGDCCLDRVEEEVTVENDDEVGWVCEPLASHSELVYVYMIGACPPHWSDEDVDDRCRRGIERSSYSFQMDIPVFSNLSKHMYVNSFCAQCHGDTEAVLPTTLHLNCPSNKENCRQTLDSAVYYPTLRQWSKVVSGKRTTVWFSVVEQDVPHRYMQQLGLRRCRAVIDKCDNQDPDDVDTEDIQGCPAFASYTYDWADASVAYKNPLCSLCHDDPPERLECDWTALPKQFQAHSQFGNHTSFFTVPLWIEKLLTSEHVRTYTHSPQNFTLQESQQVLGAVFDIVKVILKLFLS